MVWNGGPSSASASSSNAGPKLGKRRCYRPTSDWPARRGELRRTGNRPPDSSLALALADRLYRDVRQLLCAPPSLKLSPARRWGLFRAAGGMIGSGSRPPPEVFQKLLDPRYGPQLRRQLIHGLAFGAAKVVPIASRPASWMPPHGKAE